MEILAALLWVVFEALGDVVLEALLELALAAIKEILGRENHSPIVATLGYLILGAGAGGLWVWLAPARILRLRGLPGGSLVLAPLAAGLAMDAWGRYRRGRGRATTNLATWYGGGAFALGLALARYLGVD